MTQTEKKRFSMDGSALLQKIGISFCIFAFVLTMIRSAVTAITYDEALTYLWFSSNNMLDIHFLYRIFSPEGCVANNHWLNSFLIFLVEKFTVITSGGISYSEFLVRFPVLAAYAVYLTAVCRGFQKKKFSFPVLIFLVGNYYLNEFYGLARGYGLANTFVFLLCMQLIDWRQSGYDEMKHLNLAMFFGVLAMLSNTIVLLLIPAVGLLCLYRLITRKKFSGFLRKCWPVFAFFLLMTLLMVRYHLNISGEGKPLYTGEGSFFSCFVRGYVKMFLPKSTASLIGAVLLSVLVILSLIILGKHLLDLDFSLMMILFILTNLGMELALHKGYIATRVLLPFYAFMVLAIAEIIGAVRKRFFAERKPLPALERAAAAALCLICVFLFMSQIALNTTTDWSRDYKYRTLINGTYMTDRAYKENWHPSMKFYINKNEEIIQEYESYMR